MVSAPAEAAIVAACAHAEYVREVRESWLCEANALVRECTALGLRVLPSTTPYFLLQTGDADGVRARLLARHHIAVRSARSFGLPEHVRIAACRPEERARVLAALRAELCR
jgi:histidinol-phosphate/aromatic aminotransferase/cobyric acid decarboxylase-like protein